MSDLYFDQVALLLPLDTDQLDKSNNAEVVTPTNSNLSATQSKWGGFSTDFNGTSSKIAFPGVQDFSGACTIDFWLYRTTNPALEAVFEGSNILVYHNNINFQAAVNGKITLVATPSNTQNAWVYVRLVRSATGFWWMTFDGVVQDSGQESSAIDASTGDSFIGSRKLGETALWMTGFVDDFRITNGVARSSGAHTVPTEAHPLSAPPPGEEVLSYDPLYESTRAILHIEGVDTVQGPFIDDSVRGSNFTTYAGGQFSTLPLYGATSLRCSGGGDGMQGTWDSDFSPLTAFTYEVAVYITAVDLAAQEHNYFNSRSPTGPAFGGMEGRITASGAVNFIYWASTGAGYDSLATAVGVFKPDQWNRICVTSDGSNGWQIFVDGVRQAVRTTTETAIDGTTQQLHIGGNGGVRSLRGWVDELRWTAGEVRYTDDYYVRTDAFPDVGPPPPPDAYFDITTVLSNFNVNTTDNAAGTALTTVGTVILNAGSKFGANCAEVAGAGSWTAGTLDVTQPFTLETWVWKDSGTVAHMGLFGTRETAIGGFQFLISDTLGLQLNGWEVDDTTVVLSYVPVPATVPEDQWVHVALTRDINGLWRGYINAVQEFELTEVGTLGGGILGIGSNGPRLELLGTGRFDEVRVTQGQSRYIWDNFIPLDQEFSAVQAVGEQPTHDPHFASVTTLMGWDDQADGSFVFENDGTSLVDWQSAGGAAVDTAQAEYGTGSLLNGGGYTRGFYTADERLGDPCTIEYSFRRNALVSGGSGYYTRSGADNAGIEFRDYGAWTVWIRTAGHANGISVVVGKSELPTVDSQWYKFAVCHDGNGTWTSYLDGLKVYEIQGVLPPNEVVLATQIGFGSDVSGTNKFDGQFDNFRVTTGVARYSESYVPVTAEFAATSTAPIGPTIDTQPLPQVVLEYADATFFVAATAGAGALLYQWYETTAGLLGGETTDTLVVSTTFADDGNSYYVEVTDDLATTTSSTAGLTVTDILPPVVTGPADSTVLEGTAATFVVAATGEATLTYQWYETTAGLLGGETTDTLSFTTVLADDGNGYYCEVTDGNTEMSTSQTGALTVVEAPVVTVDPSPLTILAFREASFSGLATTANGPLTYDWYSVEDGLLAADAGATYTFVTEALDSGKSYYFIANDASGYPSAPSANALLTLIDSACPPSITDPLFIDDQIAGPAPVTVFEGELAVFEVTVSGTGGPFVIEWYEETAGLVQTGGNQHIVPGDLASNGNLYHVVVHNAAGICGESGGGVGALLTVTVDPYVAQEQVVSWSIADATPELRVESFQPISWTLGDGQADRGFICPIRTHRAIGDDNHTYWIPFYDKSNRCSRGPLVNDLHDRYYWTQDGQNMKYSTLAELEKNSWSDGYDVGVPAPTNAPKVSPPATVLDTDLVVDRAYVYTFVSAYGEEGPPSPPTVASGVDSGTWELTELDVWPEEPGAYNLVKKNIYRTISTDGGVDYHFVGNVVMPGTTYSDSITTDVVSNNYVMESAGWYPPPANLEGLLAHPNGFFMGFVGRDLHFSEPYRPHAWDSANVLSTIGDIVGLGVFGTTVVVCTNSNPYTATGIVPQAMVLSKHDTSEPCTSRYGIVSMPFGVYYPGPNGLMLSSGRGVENSTKGLMTKEEWRNLYHVYSLDACRYQSQYVAFYNQHQGLMFAPDEPVAALVNLDLRNSRSGVQRQDSIFTDQYSGNTYIFDGCDMYQWNPTSGAPLDYDWTSKEFDTPDPINFGAARIIWYSRYTPPSEEQTQAWRDWNTARMAAAPLNPLNYHALNEVRQEDPAGFETFPEIKQPFHWSPLIWVPNEGDAWPNTPYVIMDIVANETVIYSREVTHTRMFRLPTGFKATRWYIRLRANIPIQSVKLAETGKELARV